MKCIEEDAEYIRIYGSHEDRAALDAVMRLEGRTEDDAMEDTARLVLYIRLRVNVR